MHEAAVRDSLTEHHQAAFAWSMTCCRHHRDEAEEVLHTVYLAVLEGRARFGGRSSFRTWLFGVIRRTAAQSRRRRWLRELILERETPRLRAESEVELEPDLDAGARAAELRRALEQLSPRQRAVLDLVFTHELTVEEAATVMGVSAGSARTHYARGKARLATLLTASRQ